MMNEQLLTALSILILGITIFLVNSKIVHLKDRCDTLEETMLNAFNHCEEQNNFTMEHLKELREVVSNNTNYILEMVCILDKEIKNKHE